MNSERSRVNRENSKRSTGPKSTAGKARVAKNATTHGLAIPLRSLRELSSEAKIIALKIAGRQGKSRLEFAHAVAETIVDLRRIRAIRLQVYEDLHRIMMEHSAQGQKTSLQSRNALGLLEVVAGRFKKLERLERYEKRALSRRKRAVCAFEEASLMEVD